ncbi:MAG: radical SAM protein [Pseudomonadota bacterium]
MRRSPLLVNLEFTKHCNARCSFCTCWQADSAGELADYGPVIRKFKPVVVSVSGGEPLLRKNYAELLKGIRPCCHYLVIITNGALLNAHSAEKLHDAGVDQICVSLDFLGKKHDENRQVEGLYDHLASTIPALTKAGCRIVLNTVIMESNLGEVLPIAYRAKEWGAMLSYSAYCALKSDSDDGMVRAGRYTQLIGIVDEIRKLKRKLGHIKNSDYYLKALPAYFRDGSMPGCRAGYRWLQVTPDGYVQQCSELPRLCHYTEFTREKLKPAVCTKCWYTCRGEAEASHLKPGRLIELIRA